MIKIEELLSLAESILAAPEIDDSLLELLDRYVEQFAEWQRDGNITPNDPKLQPLADKHALVLATAQKLRDLNLADRRKLKLKGKVFRAYTELLPKNLWTRRMG